MSRIVLWPLLLFSVLAAVVATISDLRLCGDPQCKEPLSEGVTILGYPSNDKDILSFPNNARVIIYSKAAGSRQDLWGVEIKGKRGYAPLKYIRELKIHKAKPEFSVPTEAFVNNGGETPNKPNIIEDPLGKEVEEKTGGEVNAQNIKVAITAEDVEYNNLQPPPAEGEDLLGKDTTSQDTILSTNEQKQNIETSSNEEKMNGDGEEEEDGDEEEQEEEEEEEEEERDEGEDLSMLGSAVEATESSITSDQGKESQEQDVTTGKDEVFNGESTQVKPNVPQSEVKPEPQPESESGHKTESELPLPESPSVVSKVVENTAESHSSVTLEPSSVAFEVIDGTTVYIDEDVTTATTTPRDTQSSLLPQSSSVLGEAASTLPIPALLHHSPLLGSVEQHKDVNSPTEDPGVKDAHLLNTKVNLSQLPEDTISSPAGEVHLWEPPDIEKESSPFQDMASVTPTIDNEATTGMYLSTEEENDSAAEEMNESSSHVEESKLETPEEISESSSNSPLDMGTNIEETGQTTEEPEENLGIPNLEDTSDGSYATAEEPVESEGFFASWFGSSETTDPPETEETPTSSDTGESEKVPHGGPLEVEAAPSEDSRAGAEATTVDYSADILPPDSITAPVDEIKNLDTIPQTPHSADVDHNASNSYHSNLSSVENSSSASSSKEQNPEVLAPTSDNDSPIDLAHNTIDLGNSSEEEARADIGGAEEDPGPSTARPMYADPEPTTQSYPDSYVDPDDLARLAGNNEVSGGDAQGSSVEDSITQKFLKASHNLLPEGLAFGVEAEMAEPEMSHGALVFLGIVVFTIITVYLVHLVMVKFSRESPILEALNNSDREKRLLTEENKTLHEELCKARAQLGEVTSRITESSGDLSELDSQLEHVKAQHASETAEREAKMAQLEHELEEATANGIEMHKMLSEMLSTQKDTSVFQASVDHLQAMLDGQREKVETLNSDLALKSRLNEELHMELSASREQGNKLDSQVQQLTQSLKEVSASKEDTNQRLMKEIELVRELQEVNNSLSKQAVDHDGKISSLSHELEALQDTITTLRESVHTKDSELKVAKECLKQLRLTSEDDHTTGDEEKLSSLFDVIRIKAELERVSSERTDLLDQLRESEMAQKNLEDAMSSIRSEVTDLRALHDDAIQEKQEAMSKLAVLTQYFEEKEAQLTKELESQEGLRVNAEGTAASVAHKIQTYELELASYKTQVESLRKELQAQENSYKTQISSYEQKAHDNWLQARAAERKHDEQRQENSQLRNRLTLLQKEREEMQVGVLKPAPKRLDANGRMPSPGAIEGEVDGDHSESPPHPLHGPPPMLPMMFPPGAPLPPGIPPPHGFPHGVPPPPGLPRGVPPPPFLPGEPPFIRPPMPPLSGDRRLPPAGGMSSPPFRRSGSPLYNHRNDRYSPSSEHSHVSDRHYSPPPLRHRPPSPDLLRRNHSPDRRSDRLRSPDRRSDRIRSSPDHHRSNRRTPDRRLDRRSPDRHFTRSPDGYHRHRSSPHHYYDHSDYNSDDSRLHQASNKGKKTSTPLGSADRWKNDA